MDQSDGTLLMIRTCLTLCGGFRVAGLATSAYCFAQNISGMHVILIALTSSHQSYAQLPSAHSGQPPQLFRPIHSAAVHSGSCCARLCKRLWSSSWAHGTHCTAQHPLPGVAAAPAPAAGGVAGSALSAASRRLMRAGNDGRASKSGAQHSSTISRSAGGTGTPQLQYDGYVFMLTGWVKCHQDPSKGMHRRDAAAIPKMGSMGMHRVHDRMPWQRSTTLMAGHCSAFG